MSFKHSSREPINTITHWKTILQDEINCIQKLKGGEHQWVINNRKENDLWEEETLSKVMGIGKVSQEQLAMMQIISVKQLKFMTIIRLTEIAHKTKIGVKTLHELQEKVHHANEGSIPKNLIKDIDKLTILTFLAMELTGKTKVSRQQRCTPMPA